METTRYKIEETVNRFKRMGQKQIYKGIMAENSQKLMKDINLYVL